jgi:2-phospho-L-lactate/phosphoenolpyruvate guanylyltransferase
MTAVVVPFREGKSRLSDARHVRRTLGLAMLGDVVAACAAVGSVRVVTDDAEAAALAVTLGAEHVDDPGDGQGAAVAAALAGVGAGPVLVVNADLPAVVPQDLRELLHGTPRGGVAVVAALDGTTNALSLPSPDAFAPLYGQDSATRFLTHALDLGLPALEVAVASLVDDVDTLEDLERLQLRAGPRTQAAFLELEREPAP